MTEAPVPVRRNLPAVPGDAEHGGGHVRIFGQVQIDRAGQVFGKKPINREPGWSFSGSFPQISVPIYQGGGEYSLIRQSKETLAQQRASLEQVRDQARAYVVQTWGQLLAGRSQVQSAQEQVSESEAALNGVQDEARVGQRTTLDVLNAQQALVNARVALVTAQHDRVVASYAVLSAVGRLSPKVLSLDTDVYDPTVHYHQVRDSWGGVRTPDK
jgi:outer membrane protein